MVETWNYVAGDLRGVGLMLAEALRAAAGTRVRVAPLEMSIASKLGLWLRGETEDVKTVRERLEKALDERKIEWHALRWTENRARGG